MPVTSKFWLMILLLVLFRLTVPAQGRPWPVNYGNTPMQGSHPIRGFMVLTNGDTLKGYIKVFAFFDYYPILDTGTNKVQDIYFSDIESMRIYNNSPDDYSFKGYTDYVNFGDRHFLWRLDWKKKDVAIYDDMLHMGKHHLIMVTPKARITLYTGRLWFSHYDKIDSLLIHFINERYRTGVSEGNFKSMKEIIDYILDKENDLLDHLTTPRTPALQ
jgi:hypothetical protein